MYFWNLVKFELNFIFNVYVLWKVLWFGFWGIMLFVFMLIGNILGFIILVVKVEEWF